MTEVQKKIRNVSLHARPKNTTKMRWRFLRKTKIAAMHPLSYSAGGGKDYCEPSVSCSSVFLFRIPLRLQTQMTEWVNSSWPMMKAVAVKTVLHDIVARILRTKCTRARICWRLMRPSPVVPHYGAEIFFGWAKPLALWGCFLEAFHCRPSN